MDKEKEDRTTARFPPPPSYYKSFTSSNSMNPPKINILSKLNAFRSFGTEYKIKDVNNFFNPVDIQILQRLDKDKVDDINISNLKFFQDINASIQEPNQKYIKINQLNFNVIKELENETKFLQERYKNLLSNFGKSFENCEIESCLIKLSFQKIFFYLSMLKKKKILKGIADYFKNEIEENEKIESQLSENISNFQTLLIDGVNKIKSQNE